MKKRRVLPIILIIAGIALIGFSMYVTQQVEAGKIKVENAQGKVNSANGLFSQNPFSKEVGKGLTQGAQGKINEGKNQISFYEGVASTSKIAGIVALILGFGSLIFGGKSKKR